MQWENRWKEREREQIEVCGKPKDDVTKRVA